MGNEGAEVRKAFDGPEVDHDKLIGQLEARIAEEYERSSDASESAAKVKEFLEETGLNSQSVSWAKSILKKLPKKDGQSKAMDVIRSLNAILPMLENHVAGQGTVEMDLEGPQDDPETIDEPESPEATDPEIAEDSDDFDAAADAALGDNVVTPIDFLNNAPAAE